MVDTILEYVENLREDMVSSLADMCRIPAIAPESGGDGEVKRAMFLQNLLTELGFEHVAVIRVDDSRVSDGYRPNIIVKIHGQDKTLPPLWVVTHMDVVPDGDRNLWDFDPFDPVIRGGRLIGRGVEDNGQALIASLFAAKALMNAGVKPKRNIKLAFVADEEVGSTYGIKYLVRKGFFIKKDLIIVPDAGEPDGRAIEVVEKANLNIKVVTHGKQTHASRPNKGINAFRAASKFIDKVTDALYKKFNEKNELFVPPNSTFEVTKKEPNVQNVNTIPGEDIFYMDCRILPNQPLEEILDFIRGVVSKVSKETGAVITLENVRYAEAPPATPLNSQVVMNLQVAIKKIRGMEARPVGIGGGTCAAFFREKGLPVAVWATNEETAHEPNENIKIDNLVDDAKVFALMYLM
jgi:succinyl-diaminopimelate desuccinylase